MVARSCRYKYDRGERGNLLFRNTSTPVQFGPRQDYIVGTAAVNAKVVDCDGDGKPDNLTGNGTSIVILKNQCTCRDNQHIVVRRPDGGRGIDHPEHHGFR